MQIVVSPRTSRVAGVPMRIILTYLRMRSIKLLFYVPLAPARCLYLYTLHTVSVSLMSISVFLHTVSVSLMSISVFGEGLLEEWLQLIVNGL